MCLCELMWAEKMVLANITPRTCTTTLDDRHNGYVEHRDHHRGGTDHHSLPSLQFVEVVFTSSTCTSLDFVSSMVDLRTSKKKDSDFSGAVGLVGAVHVKKARFSHGRAHCTTSGWRGHESIDGSHLPVHRGEEGESEDDAFDAVSVK